MKFPYTLCPEGYLVTSFCLFVSLMRSSPLLVLCLCFPLAVVFVVVVIVVVFVVVALHCCWLFLMQRFTRSHLGSKPIFHLPTRFHTPHGIFGHDQKITTWVHT